MTAFSVVPSGGWNAPVNALSAFPMILTQSGSTAILSWAAVADAVSYTVCAGPNDEPIQRVVANQAGTTAMVSGLATGVVYAFLVLANMGDGSTRCSQAVRNLNTISVSAVPGSGGTSLQLNFMPAAGATGYNIYIGTAAGTESPAPIPQSQVAGGPWALANAGGFLVQGLAAGPTYYAMVQGIFGNWLGQCAGTSASNLATVYYGFVGSTSPTAANVQALFTNQQSSFQGSYPITQPGTSANFPCFAFPAAFGVPDAFAFGGFTYGMQSSQVTIGGVAYNVYLNPNATYASAMTWTVS
jgi:hypothetical protein